MTRRLGLASLHLGFQVVSPAVEGVPSPQVEASPGSSRGYARGRPPPPCPSRLTLVACKASTARRLVADFRQHEEEATLRIHEKGGQRRTVSLHFLAANAVQAYLEQAGLKTWALFRARLNSRSQQLGRKRMSRRSLYRLLMGYLERQPKSLQEVEDPANSGQTRRACLYCYCAVRKAMFHARRWGMSRSPWGRGTR
jgi:hypothetical protein